MGAPATATRVLARLWPAVALILIVLAIALLTGALAGLVIERVVILMLINMVMVIGLYVFSGVSGVISFGHLSFAALGAYMCAWLTIPTALKQSLFADMPGFMRWVLDVEIGLLPAVVAGGLFAALFALVIAPAFVRMNGVQAGIATLALLAVVYTVLISWRELTRGASTMIGVPADMTLTIAAGGAIAAIAIAFAYQSSSRGLVTRASREDLVAARSVGIRVPLERTGAWVLSAFVVGCGGALYSHFLTTFNPNAFYLAATFVILAMLVLGGVSSLAGAVVGTIAFSVLSEVLRRVQGGDLGPELPAGTAEVVLAGLLLLMLIKRPAGLMGGREIGWPPRWRRAAGPGAPGPSPGTPPAGPPAEPVAVGGDRGGAR